MKLLFESWRDFALDEGKAEDVVEKFPELQPAYDAGIRNAQYLNWMRKRSSGEPIEDIIGVVQQFDKDKVRLKAKGKSSDIYSYKDAALLRQALEDIGVSRAEKERAYYTKLLSVREGHNLVYCKHKVHQCVYTVC